MTAVESTPEELRRLVRDHGVLFSVYPEWGPDKTWTPQKVGYALELVGTHFQPEHPPSPGCPECRRVYDALHRIAEWTLPQAERRSRYELDQFDGRLSDSPRHGFREEVTLTIRIVHRDEYRRPVDECENECLSEMVHKLEALGARRE